MQCYLWSDKIPKSIIKSAIIYYVKVLPIKGELNRTQVERLLEE